MNNNQLNGLFTDFRQFNPYFCPFSTLKQLGFWGFGVLVEISLITDNLPTDKWVGRIKYKMNVGWVEA